MSTETSVNDWQTSFEKEMEMLRLTATEGNVAFITTYQEKTIADASASSNKRAMNVSANYAVPDVYKQMKEMCDTAINESKSDYAALEKSLRSFKETKSDATEEDWKKHLSELADKQTAACNKRFDDIKRFAVEMLRKIPEAIRETAAKIHKLAISAIGKLVSTVFNWLDHALQLPQGFYSNILEKINEFGKKVDEWVSAAFNAVNTVFESASRASSHMVQLILSE